MNWSWVQMDVCGSVALQSSSHCFLTCALHTCRESQVRQSADGAWDREAYD